MKFLYRFIQLEVLDDIVNIPGEPVDIILKVDVDVLRILFKSGEIVLGSVIKLSMDTAFNDGGGFFDLGFIFLVKFEDFVFSGFDDTIQPPEDYKW